MNAKIDDMNREVLLAGLLAGIYPDEFGRYGPFGDALAPFVVDAAGPLGDGACRRGIGFYSTTALLDGDGLRQSDPAQCNAEVALFSVDTRGRPSRRLQEWVVATRFIAPAQEIVTDYGPRFAVETDPANPHTHTTY